MTILDLINTIFLAYALYSILACMVGLARLKRNLNPSRSRKNTDRYLFIFPVYKEQKIIDLTFSWYEKFLSGTQIDIAFICSPEPNHLIKTHELLTELIKKSKYKNRYYLFTHYSNKATKAIKLNYVIRKLHSKNYNFYITFDADAKISKQDFIRAVNSITKNKRAFILSFIPFPQRNSKSQLVNAHRANHFLRMIIFEVCKDFFPSYISYPMGATMIIRRELFNHIDKIPEPIDDLPLGYVMTAKKLKFTTLPLFTKVQSSPNIKNLFRSYIPIYTGVFSIAYTLNKFSLNKNSYKLSAIILRYAFVAVEFIFPFWSIISLLVFKDYILITLFFIQILISTFALDEFSLFNIAMSPVGHVLKVLTLLNYLRVKIFNKSVTLASFKTDRT